ncbi:MBOAT family protein [Fusobacterium nucleatum subsp. nucleatum ATCC 23726]|uniref:MBOAT family protein n=1 Tax=Fusobacterium nucleatum subsp. nucleatum (strain ATCC 23726 / VPI 4351) TaxID=525283 RepID=D5RFF3_FUSN2|nr:MBOAT family O-acyltransferase [Fusobacterium nucleatum]AVQ22367.1 MBOAT family protein [Fusobacterium nucleatum subsp. nucleatum ATCC 23726]EFG94417.1 conserved hypothetical protein TIGR03982 [Fusobacterium nucleatum subsp. nucleatum ATCC 23726]
MLFTTNIFLFLFFLFCILGYFTLDYFNRIKLNNLYLVLASLFFYAWAGIDVALYFIIFIIYVYLASHLLENSENDQQRKIRLISVLISLVGLLVYIKYFNFFILNFNFIFKLELTQKNIIVPLGISFITFEAISYILDVYWKKAKATTLLDIALFLSFFPKVVSGPIVLWRDFSSQINNRKVSLDLLYNGVERIMIGFAKKTIIADTLGLTVSNIMENLEYGIDNVTAIGGMLCYTLQLYYDFSGYSDIAIGISNCFGFEVKENFNFPYISSSITEFWRRWHISLGTWFREYLYIPLGENKKGNIYLNLFIVFLITGIWHGVRWNYIIWGGIHGFFIVLECYLNKNTVWYNKINLIYKRIFTFLIVSFSWIIFMLPEWSMVKKYYAFMFTITQRKLDFTYSYYFNSKVITLIVIGFLGAVLCKEIKNEKIKMVVYPILFILAIIFMINSTYSPFLYFQF